MKRFWLVVGGTGVFLLALAGKKYGFPVAAMFDGRTDADAVMAVAKETEPPVGNELRRAVGDSREPGRGDPFDLDRMQALPDMPVADLIAMLEPRARGGDAAAARLIYLGLFRCRTWPLTATNETAFIDPVLLQRMGMDEVEFRRRRDAGRAQEAQIQAEDCRGVEPAQIATAGDWLRISAEAGDAYAQLAYVDASDEVIGNATQMLADPDAVARFRRDSVRYLRQLAQRGVPEAMARLSGIYGSGVLAEKDLVQAYAYGEAAEQMSGSPVPDPSLDEYRLALSGDQLRAARAMARSLVHGGR